MSDKIIIVVLDSGDTELDRTEFDKSVPNPELASEIKRLLAKYPLCDLEIWES